MKKNLTSVTTVIVLCAALAIPVELAAQAPQQRQNNSPRYAVIDLGTLGGTFSVGWGVTDKRLASGTSTIPGDAARHAFLEQHGRKTDLGTLGGPNSAVFSALNHTGAIVGQAETSTPDPLGENFCFFGTGLTCLPFLWQNGVMTPLPTLGGTNGFANRINNRNQAGGAVENTTLDSTCSAPALESKPVIWEKGQIHELPTFGADPDGFTSWINENGQAVGGSGQCFTGPLFSLHALLWDNGTAIDLGSLGGKLFSIANGNNDNGQVVGVSNLPGDTSPFASPFDRSHGFLWQNGVMTDLGTLPGDAVSFAQNLNNRGQIVGLGSRAILWQNGVATDLNTLVPGPPFSPLYLLQALYISEREEIVGLGLTINGEQHGYLAIPCDDAHADAEPCKNNVGTAAPAVFDSPAPSSDTAGPVSEDNPAGNNSRTRLDRLRPQRVPGHRFPRLTISLRN